MWSPLGATVASDRISPPTVGRSEWGYWSGIKVEIIRSSLAPNVGRIDAASWGSIVAFTALDSCRWMHQIRWYWRTREWYLRIWGWEMFARFQLATSNWQTRRPGLQCCSWVRFTADWTYSSVGKESGWRWEREKGRKERNRYVHCALARVFWGNTGGVLCWWWFVCDE